MLDETKQGDIASWSAGISYFDRLLCLVYSRQLDVLPSIDADELPISGQPKDEQFAFHFQCRSSATLAAMVARMKSLTLADSMPEPAMSSSSPGFAV